jgi:hypothetical protein
MPAEEKLFLGLQRFDRSCRIMADGIRDEFPDADENRVQEILASRLAMIRRLEQTSGIPGTRTQLSRSFGSDLASNWIPGTRTQLSRSFGSDLASN